MKHQQGPQPDSIIFSLASTGTPVVKLPVGVEELTLCHFGQTLPAQKSPDVLPAVTAPVTAFLLRQILADFTPIAWSSPDYFQGRISAETSLETFNSVRA